MRGFGCPCNKSFTILDSQCNWNTDRSSYNLFTISDEDSRVLFRMDMRTSVRDGQKMRRQPAGYALTIPSHSLQGANTEAAQVSFLCLGPLFWT